MKNKFFKEYMDNIYNEEKNYKAITSRFEKTDNIKNKKKLNMVAMFMGIVVLGIVSSQAYAKISWNIEFKEYKNRNYEEGFGVIEENGYTEKVDMNYINQNGINAKVDSLFITDDEFKAKIDFEFDKDIELNSETFTYGFVVYDENKNIYVMNFRTGDNQIKKKSRYILEEIGVKYNRKDIFGGQLANQWGVSAIEAIDRNIVTELNIHSVEGFPRSRKVYIRVFDLGYDMFDKEGMESFTISDSEFIFEIDVPEKFYERLTTNLQLQENIPGVEISKVAVTEYGMQITGKIEGINDIIMQGKDMIAEEWDEKNKNLFYITDGNGNRYNHVNFGTYKEGKDSIHASFEVTKKTFEEAGLYLNYTDSSGNLYVIQLIKK